MALKCIDNNAFELGSISTPVSKRKREPELENTDEYSASDRDACFNNAGFSSTPKNIQKLTARRRKSQYENNIYTAYSCLEEKSIAGIIAERQKEEQNGCTGKATETVIPINPYEVQRKPPKKKKRQSEAEEACFENPALNLELPERQFNPFEVCREPPVVKEIQCFINKALNIRGNDPPATRNPFEIPRVFVDLPLTPPKKGVENLGMEELQPTNIQIGLPFVPTVGCRIDFQNVNLSELTPSKMLSQKLVFSPQLAPKRSLEAISEESSMDIGRELDQYQLELENSINEAKLRKNGIHNESDKPLQVLHEEVTNEVQECRIDVADTEPKNMDKVNHDSISNNDLIKEKPNNENMNKLSEIDFTSESEEDDIDFKRPTPFVRTYRRADPVKKSNSKESINSAKSGKSNSSPSREENFKNVKNIIRRSIRKLVHPMQSNGHEKMVESDSGYEEEKHSNIISSIRHSLRRKPSKPPIVVQEKLPELEISIIDISERKMKLKSNETQMEFAKIEQLTTEKRYTLRNSIRRSTREIMKTVFHKEHEQINFRSSKI